MARKANTPVTFEVGRFVTFTRDWKHAEGIQPDLHEAGSTCTIIESGRDAGCISLEGARIAVQAGAATLVARAGDVETWPKPVGGGYYELSDGRRLRGKVPAAEAQAQLAG